MTSGSPLVLAAWMAAIRPLLSPSAMSKTAAFAGAVNAAKITAPTNTSRADRVVGVFAAGWNLRGASSRAIAETPQTDRGKQPRTKQRQMASKRIGPDGDGADDGGENRATSRCGWSMVVPRSDT
jgi:hypothetical protein